MFSSVFRLVSRSNIRNSFQSTLSTSSSLINNSKKRFSTSSSSSSLYNKFWTWTTQPRKSWREDYVEGAILFVLYGLAGSSFFFIKPIFNKYLNLTLFVPFEFNSNTLSLSFAKEGKELKEGSKIVNIINPFYILVFSPVYACVTLVLGTLAGRHPYFARSYHRILSRYVPKNYRNNIICDAAKATKVTK